MKDKKIQYGCDYCGLDRQVKMYNGNPQGGIFMHVYLCNACWEIVKEVNKKMSNPSKMTRDEYLKSL